MRLRALIAIMFAYVVLSTTIPLWAQDDMPNSGVEVAASFDFMRDVGRPAIMSIVFTLIGLFFFAVCIWLIVKVTPFSVQKEIEEDQNTSLGIIIGSMIIGIAIILASAIAG